jgi:hypothetical protein
MSAQTILTARYGPPTHDYLVKYCTVWHIQQEFPWFPVASFLVNKDFQAKLRLAFQALEKAGIHTEIKTYDGCYNDRDVRGSSSASLHSWAAALDMNAADNPMTRDPDPVKRHGKWSPLFIQIMKGAGIYWGGDWVSRADPMHFGLQNG